MWQFNGPPPRAPWVRHHLSSNHLFSAHLFAQSAAEIESAEGRTNDQYLKHRSFVIASIMSSVAFLEAAINELYVVCAEHPDHIRQRAQSQDEQFPLIGVDTIQLLAAIWQVQSFQRSANLLQKCQTALRLARRVEFDKGTNPYQDARLVIDLRNLLVHFKPEQREIAVGTGSKLPPDDFETRYHGKFADNPMAITYAMISPVPSPIEADYPFFPEKCLGSGCAHWASGSMRTFTDEVFRRLGLTWDYFWLFGEGMMLESAA